ncbi:MAG: S8 family serine peptidase [Methylococcales bacterium]|nr:S8 family serine peptidase [Methylococcales bacterium]
MKFILLVLLVVQLSGCANKTDYSHLGDSQNAEERRLLVTFVDRSINRELSGNAQDNYQLRGQYNNSSWSERMGHQLAERHQLHWVAQWPVSELGVSCVVYEVPETLALQEVITALQKELTVSLVQKMHSFDVLGEQPSAVKSYSDPYLQLQTGFQSLGIHELHKSSTGQGIRIALIDTGVDLNHPDLKGQISYFENLAPEPDDHNLADKHGTAVAGVLSALPDNGIGIAGIAPGAEILAFRACWPIKPGSLAARCNSFTLALALNQAIRMDSRIVNLSLSGPDDPLLQQLIEKALAKGIIVIAAVPGNDHVGGFPGSIPGVIAVGQSGVTNNSEIIAPGQDILTTVPHQAYDFMTGSSFSTPHVAGVVALLLQLHPVWHTADIKRLLDNDSHLLTAKLIDLAMAAAKLEDKH